MNVEKEMGREVNVGLDRLQIGYKVRIKSRLSKMIYEIFYPGFYSLVCHHNLLKYVLKTFYV